MGAGVGEGALVTVGRGVQVGDGVAVAVAVAVGVGVGVTIIGRGATRTDAATLNGALFSGTSTPTTATLHDPATGFCTMIR
jgi:hypothetical protein